jgi:hypothetical protein
VIWVDLQQFAALQLTHAGQVLAELDAVEPARAQDIMRAPQAKHRNRQSAEVSSCSFGGTLGWWAVTTQVGIALSVGQRSPPPHSKAFQVADDSLPAASPPYTVHLIGRPHRHATVAHRKNISRVGLFTGGLSGSMLHH